MPACSVKDHDGMLAAAKLARCRVKERLHGRGVHITERHGH
jgi:hypothetical protein